MMRRALLITILVLVGILQIGAQGSDSLATFVNPSRHEIVSIISPKFRNNPRNVILFIGDGMGVSQFYSALVANGGQLNINHMKHIGFIHTQSADNFVTDSGAGGTAIATGTRTFNGAISVDVNNQPLETILQMSEKNGKATGMVSTSAITHATPASFIAHQPSRNLHEEIAADFLKTDIDIFIGGGEEHFTNRKDGRNLVAELRSRGYSVFSGLEAAGNTSKSPMAIFTSPGHNPPYPGRGQMLPAATQKAINVLSRDKNGFFLMVEGSQIDWAGHANNTPYMVKETLDMDIAVGKALEFAARNRETLVIVTADHETGGMTINGGSFETGTVYARYTTRDHSAVMVPVFAFGPGAEEFIGIYNNTDIFHKIKNLFGF